MNNFSSNIKYLLANLNISRDEFAKIVGKKRSVIGSYIRGEAQPHINILIRIADYFGIDLNILITMDIEKELKNSKINDIRQLQSLLYDKNKKYNKIGKMPIKNLKKNQILNDKFMQLLNKIDHLNNEQKSLFYENSRLKEKVVGLYKINKERNSITIFSKYFNLKNIALFYILISFLCIAYFGVKYLVSLNDLSNDDIFNKYYRPYKEDIYKGNNVGILKIKEYYAYGDYYRILEEFDEFSDEDSIFINNSFYKGLACMELSQVQSAIENFNKIVLYKNNKYSDEARWYLALCYLKVGQNGRAKGYFEEITNVQRYKRNEAKEILRQIK